MQLRCAALLIVLIALPLLADAHTLCVKEENLYNAVLVTIAEKAKPPRIAVWHKSISADELVKRKVQGHWPKGQFSKYVPGVSLDMEMELLYVSQGPPNNIFADNYPWISTLGIEFLGVVDAQVIPRIEGTTVAKLSNLGFDDRHSKALVYVESFVAGYEQAGGNAFLFERAGNVWCLKRHVPLWFGGRPSWLDNDD